MHAIEFMSGARHIVESGRHSELLGREGLYYAMCAAVGGAGEAVAARHGGSDDSMVERTWRPRRPDAARRQFPTTSHFPLPHASRSPTC